MLLLEEVTSLRLQGVSWRLAYGEFDQQILEGQNLTIDIYRMDVYIFRFDTNKQETIGDGLINVL